MSALTPAALEWLGRRREGVLITLRRDGSPQSSNILYAFDGSDFRISVTADRAKTRNLARDPRAVLHVVGADFWSYASVTVTARLGEVSTSAGDQAGQDLLATYEVISGKAHPDPAEYFAVQVAEQRLLLTLHAESVTGMGWG